MSERSVIKLDISKVNHQEWQTQIQGVMTINHNRKKEYNTTFWPNPDGSIEVLISKDVYEQFMKIEAKPIKNGCLSDHQGI